MPRVLNVGHCDYDHGNIARLLKERFQAHVDRAAGLEDTLTFVKRTSYDLVLVNRLMDRDGSEGMEIIRRLKDDPTTKTIPVMLISNYAEAQASAVAAGALPGFGKASLDQPETLIRLKAALAPTDVVGHHDS